MNLEITAFVNTPPVFQQDIDGEEITVQEETDYVYFFPSIFDPDSEQETVVKG